MKFPYIHHVKNIQLVIIICFSTILSDISGQVLVRCSGGNFNNGLRCVPTEESLIDSYTITPCDCNDPQNVYADQNYCRRTITLHTDNPKIPSEITAFDFPYFALEPLSMSLLRGPNMQQLVSYMEPTGEINPNVSADDQNVALLLEIDITTGDASFEAWVPMGEEHTIQVYTDFVDETGNDWRFITIPADDCDEVIKTCYTFPSGNSNVTIQDNNTSNYSFIQIFNPLEGRLADINIKNVNITHQDHSDLEAVLVSPSGTSVMLFGRFFCDGNGTTNIAFDGLGTLDQNCFQSQANQAEQSLEVFYRDPTIKGNWELRINDAFIGDIGSFHSWELEICVVEDICGPLKTSTDTPITIGPNVSLISSVINIPETGKVSEVSISNLNIAHEYSGDLRISLESPLGTTAVVVDRICAGNMGYNMAFGDNANENLNCNYVFGAVSKPNQSFTVFNNEEIAGEWRLIVEDLVDSDGGQLLSWSINICTDCIDGYSTSNNNQLKGSIPIDYSYNARQTIASQHRIIGKNELPIIDVVYRAGATIELQREFEVRNGVNFQAVIDNCN